MTTTLSVTERGHALVCAYCVGSFVASRSDRRTCSTACRMAMSRALALADDGEVELPSLRRECFSRERRDATGWGMMTRRQMYEADLRVRDCRERHRNHTRER